MLLLYGLLIALVLVLWTALTWRRKGTGRAQGAAAGADEVQQPATPQAARAGSGNGARSGNLPPAGQCCGSSYRLTVARTADSESVVSYSVRPRVNAAEDRVPASRHRNGPGREPEPAQLGQRTGRLLRRRAAATVLPVRQRNPVDQLSGADSGQPQGAGARRPGTLSGDSAARMLNASCVAALMMMNLNPGEPGAAYRRVHGGRFRPGP